MGGVERKDESVFLYAWGSRGGFDGQFEHPISLAVGMDGRVYVVDMGNHRIQCFDSKGAYLFQWGKEGQENGDFLDPGAISIASYAGHNESMATCLKNVPVISSFPPGLLPICLAYIGNECIIVADTSNHRVQVFGGDGTFMHKWGKKGGGNGEFNQPSGCCAVGVGAEAIVHVLDYSFSLQTFKVCDGTFVRKFVIENIIASGLAASRDGSIYVCGRDAGTVVYYSGDGKVVGRWYPTVPSRVLKKGKGYKVLSGPKRQIQPIDILINENLIYLADTYESCICEFQIEDKRFIRQWGKEGNADGEFYNPCGLAQNAGKDLLYIADTDNHRIVAINVKTV